MARPPQPFGRVDKSCSACGESVRPDTRYCPRCGAYQDPARDRQARFRKVRAQWRAVRGIILFYVILLGTCLPINWLPEEHEATGIMAATVVDVFLILGYWRLTRTRLLERFHMAPPAPLALLAGLGGLVPLLGINVAYHRGLQHLLDLEGLTYTEEFKAGGYGFLVIVLVICVMPGIWEEIAFRGLIQGRLRPILGPREALLLTAVVFAIIHCSILSLPYLFLLGLVLGYLREWSDSLIPGMAVHFLHNLAVILLETW